MLKMIYLKTCDPLHMIVREPVRIVMMIGQDARADSLIVAYELLKGMCTMSYCIPFTLHLRANDVVIE